MKKQVLFITVFALLSAIFIAPLRADQVDDLIVQLKDEDPFVIIDAVEQLSELNDDRAVEPLIELLKSSTTETANPSSTAVTTDPDKLSPVDKAKYLVAGGKLPFPSKKMNSTEFNQNVRALRQGTHEDKQQAIVNLSNSGDHRAISQLARFLKTDRRASVFKRDIYNAIGLLNGPQSFPTLQKIIQEEGVFAHGAVGALGYCSDPRAAHLLNDLMQELSFRHEAMEALKIKGGYDSVLVLNNALQSEDMFIKRQAQDVLDSFGPEYGLEPLLKLLDSSDEKIRTEASEALTKLNNLNLILPTDSPSETNAPNTSLLQGDNLLEAEDVQLAVISALGKMKSAKALSPLTNIMFDKNNSKQLRQVAGQALRQFNTSTIVRRLQRGLNSNNKTENMDAVECLGFLGDDRSVRLLIQLVENENIFTPVKKEIILAMGLSNNPKAAEYLITLLPNAFLGDSAMDGLLNFDSSLYLSKVAKTYSSMNFVIQDKITDMIISKQDPAGTAVLLEAINDRSVDDKFYKALLDFGQNVPVESIINSLKSDNSWAFLDSAFALLDKIATSKDAPAIFELLKCDQHDFKKPMALLKKLNYKPQSTEDKVIYYIADRNWDQCKALGKSVMQAPLLDNYKTNHIYEIAEILTEWKIPEIKQLMMDYFDNWSLSSKEYTLLTDQWSFKPLDINQRISAAFASNDENLLKNVFSQSQTRAIILKKLHSRDYSPLTVIINHAIQIKQKDMVPEIIRAFSSFPDSDLRSKNAISNILLSSNNKQMYDAAYKWAESKKEIRIHTIPTFSSGNSQW